MELAGLTAIVTGGAVRIGRAIAMELGRHGMNVLLHYGHSQQAAEETRSELQAFGGRAELVQADFTNPVTAAKTVCQRAVDVFGGADVLINSAAIFEAATLEDTSEELWDQHFAINLKTPFFLCQQFARQFRNRGSGDGSTAANGAMINIVDWRAARPDAGFLAYSLTKSGLVSLTQGLAKSLGPGIRVNAIAPGAILPAPGSDPAEFEERGQRNPLKRTGNPQQITDAVLYLLQAEFVTGEVLTVSGGEQL